MLIIIAITTFSCSSLSLSNGRQKVIVRPQQAPCDIQRKEIDPNCKIEDKTLYRNDFIKFGNPNAA